MTGTTLVPLDVLFPQEPIREAYILWCELTGTEQGDMTDGDWVETCDALIAARYLLHLGVPEAAPAETWPNFQVTGAPDDDVTAAALAIVTSAEYSNRVHSLSHGDAAVVVAAMMRNALVTPTGFEDQPWRLAEHLTESVIGTAEHFRELLPMLIDAVNLDRTTPASGPGSWLARTIIECALLNNDVADAVFQTLGNSNEHEYHYVDIPGPHGGYVLYRALPGA